ncbi:MAG: PKD domain-containing protein [Bacteroidota bacterium]
MFVYKCSFLSRNLLTLCCLFLFSTTTLLGQTLTATNGDNDAFIEISWNLPATCFSTGGVSFPNDAFLELTADGVRIHSEVIQQDVPAAVVSSFNHRVGPNKMVNYALTVREIGPGTIACTTPNASGSTLPFQAPTAFTVTNSDFPDKVELTWQNQSRLTSNFSIFRDNVLIGTVAATDVVGVNYSFTDSFRVDNPTQFVNGQSYNYCLELFSQQEGQAFPQQCATGRSFDLGFTASDNTMTDAVRLDWNDLSSISTQFDKIIITRNGSPIKTLAKDATMYLDGNPVYGQNSVYGLSLERNSTVIVTDFDNGSVPRNGAIAGKVATQDNLFPLENVRIRLEGTAGDTLVLDSVLTDFAGCFSFPSIFYDELTNFTLTAIASGQTFAANPKTVTLSNIQPTNLEVLFLAETDFTIDEDEVVIQNLQTNPIAGADKIDLSWSYTPVSGQTTFFNIFRGADLIARLNDANGNITTFTDLEGKPNTRYTYRIVAYRLNNGLATQGVVQGDTTFLPVAPVASLTAVANTAGGVVNLTWPNHSSNNFAGFRIERNGAIIAELPVGTTTFTDKTATPNTQATYTIKTIRQVDGITYESVPVGATAVTVPALPAALNVTVTPVANGDLMQIAWQVPNSLNANYNYTGFDVYRKETGSNTRIRIAQKLKGFSAAGTTVNIDDLTGKPNTNYTYEICTFLATPDTTFMANAVGASGVFPAVKVPANLTASGALGQVNLLWNAHTSNNHAGFIIYRGANEDSIGIAPVQATTFTDYINNPPITTNQLYTIKSYRIVEGQIYVSVGVTAMGMPTAGGNTPEIATNFTASKDVNAHVKLCWDYPEFILAQFKIFRDGQLLTTLAPTARAYYDYNATPGQTHIYSVETTLSGNTSQKVFAEGRLASNKRLYGKAFTADNGIGLPKVLITVTGTNFFAQTFTDSTGLYVISNLPDQQGLMLTVTAAGDNSDFGAGASASITIATTQTAYQVNFADNFTPPLAESNTIAIPTDMTGFANPEIMGYTIGWTPSNNNYSGFEVFRGLSVIGEVNRGEPLSFVDTLGAPSANYIYRVRAFLDSPDGRQFSDYFGFQTVYPTLEPVTNLTATAQKEKNQVLVSWSHPYDQHTAYFVRRNGALVAQVPTGEVLAFLDTTGMANHLYTYTVTAIKINAAGVFESEEQAVELTYPDVYRVENLQSAPTVNTVELLWAYENEAADGFEVYRDNALIASLPADQRNYRDTMGIPQTSHEYTVRAFYTRMGNLLTSRPRTVTELFPKVAMPTNITAASNTNLGLVEIRTDYPTPQVDGFDIFSGTNLVATIFPEAVNGNYSIIYPYKNGIPNTPTTFGIKAFVVRDGNRYESDLGTANTINFPAVPKPINVNASDGTLFNAVEITWDYNQAICPDSFNILRNGTFIGGVNGGQGSFTDVINELSGVNNYTYTVVALRSNGTTLYASTNNNTDTGFPANRSINATEVAEGTQTNQDFGYAVAIDGNLMVVGAPGENSNAGMIYLYEFDGKDWVFKAQRSGTAPEQLGFSVDIDGATIIAGQPGGGNGFGVGGFTSIFDYDGTNINFVTVGHFSNRAGDQIGYDVAIDGNWAIAGGPFGENLTPGAVGGNTGGRVEVARFIGGAWQPQAAIFGNGTANGQFLNDFGAAVAIDGDYLVVGDPAHDTSVGSGNKDGLAFVYKNINNVWTYQTFLFGSRVGANDRFANDVQIEGNRIICGAFIDEGVGASTGSGLAYIFEGSDANWTETALLEGDNVNSISDFGVSVAIEGDFAVVGDNRFMSGGIGDAYLFEKNGNSWIQRKRFSPTTLTNGSDFGRSVALSGKHIAVGAPEYLVNGQARGKVFNFSVYDFLQTVTASDGQFINRTLIEWTFDGAETLIDGFNIYRDGDLIHTATSTARNYSDEGGIGGLEYLYSVAVKFADNTEGATICDKGASLADGELSGNVMTSLGSAPVAGVTITATAEVDGAFYSYETQTATNGNYLIPNVFYGANGADYTITPTAPNSNFAPSSIERTLTTNQNTAQFISFLDLTAYVIQGTIRHEDLVCGYDSIRVKAISKITGADDVMVETFSDEEGNYNLAVNIFQAGLESITIEVDSQRIIGNGNDQQIIKYDFVAQQPTVFTNFSNFPITTQLDFFDQTRYPVEIIAQTTCIAPISSDIFSVRVRTLDGCYDRMFNLNNLGKGTFDLPPADLVITLDDVNNPTVENLVALNYLAARPSTLNLYNLHVDDATDEDDAADLTAMELADLTRQTLTFHTPSRVSVNGFQDYYCEDLARPALIEQNGQYTLNIQVQETHGGVSCNVQEGFVQITNPAGVNADTILQYDPTTGGFPQYKFTAGFPNLIAPNTWAMKVEYFSGNGDFLGSTVQPILVTGIAAIPGSDVIVNPADDPDDPNSFPPLPMFILRDPPGDGSSATISQGQTFERSVSYNESGQAGIGAFFDLNIALAKVLLTTEGQTTFGGGGDNSNTTAFTVTTNTEISTSADETGRAADIIVGVGLAMQYGLAVRVDLGEVQSDGCPAISNVITTAFTPAEIATEWNYTIGQIEGIIGEYEQTITDVEAGRREFLDSEGEVIEKEDAIERFQNLRNNWQTILTYHDERTLPQNMLCNEAAFGVPDATDLEDGEDRLTEIQNWKDAFCALTGLDGIWSTELMDAYNVTINAIRILGDPVVKGSDALQWAYAGNAFANPLQFQTLVGYNELGSPAANLTFGGGVSRTETFGQTQNSEATIGKFFYNVGEFKLGAGLKSNDMAGFGLITTVAEVDSKAGGVIEWEASSGSERVNSEENGVEMSYTLEDADVGDQFSVNIIRSLALNHTPYFQLVGGRSSCPEEEGTIFRDRPEIFIVENGAAATSTSIFEVPEVETVTFQLQLANGNLFGESRDVEVFLDNTSNLGSAIVSLGSDQLGVATVAGVPANGSIVLPLNIQRGLVTYEHNDLRIGIRPACGGPEKFVTVTVHFQNPCSPITITTPDNNWILNGEENELIIGVRDYQPDNPILEKIKMQYRRTDTGDDWEDIPLRFIRTDLGSTVIAGFNPPPAEISAEFLAAYNATFFGPGETPTFFFVWELPDNLTEFPDGAYELRAVADCATEGMTFSNLIAGNIDRSGLRLFGVPEPADGIWVPGDEISVSFNQNLNCSLLDDPAFVDTALVITNLSNNNAPVPFSVACLNNQLVFTLDNPTNFDGQDLRVTVEGITDLAGNVLPDSVAWDFKVITQQLFWGQDTVRLQLYEDEVVDVAVRLENTSLVNTVNNVSMAAQDGNQDAWITFTPLNNFSVTPAGRAIDFQLTGNQALGTYTETILVNGLPSGNPPALTFEITVIPRAPNWSVNAADFSSSMNMVANWRFTTEAATAISTDIKDQISVWVDNEIRGIANIEAAGNGFFAAYLTIFGEPVDADKSLTFRIWDAATGTEYDGRPTETIPFVVDTIIGNTASPQMLLVDPVFDEVRYIPLNQGWTWFSVNTILTDNSVNNWMSSLSKVSNGDQIKTGDKFAQYVAGTGWVAAGNEALTTISPNEGYLIFLQNGPDTLRIAGANATPPTNLALKQGWNWIGYPLQTAGNINSVLDVFNVADNDRIVTIRQDNTAAFSLYENTNMQWSGSLTTLRPFDAYKINIGNAAAVLNYIETTPFREEELPELAAKSRTPADSQNQNTWNLDPLNFQYTIPLVGEVKFNGVISSNTNDRIAAFVGNDLRGVGNVGLVGATNKYLVSLLIGGTTANETFDLYYYNAAQNRVYEITDQLTLDLGTNNLGSTGFGNFETPYPLEIALFTTTVEKRDVFCAADQSGFIEVTPNGAFTPTYEWSHDVNATGNRVENLAAGTYMVSITDTRNIPVVVTVEILNNNANLTPPTISGIMPICQGDALTLTASNATFPNATFNWFDQDNNLLLANNSQLVLNNLQQTQTIKVLSVVNGVCFSDVQSEQVIVNQATPATFTVSTRTPIVNQAVTFTPTVQVNTTNYAWNFGDGNTSTDRVAQHTYTTAGDYTVTLMTTTAANCTANNISVNFITVGDVPTCSSGDPNINLTGTIAAGNYHAANSIVADGQIAANTNVDFKAGQTITLTAGFSAAAGSTFSATLLPCTLPTPITDLAESRQAPVIEAMTTSTDLTIAPNPSAGLTNLGFNLPEEAYISLAIYDSRGALVEQLIKGRTYGKGTYQVVYQPDHTAYGLYYVVLQKDKTVLNKKLILVR